MEHKEEKGVRKKSEYLNRIQVTREKPTENIHEFKLKKSQNCRRKPGSMRPHPRVCPSAGFPIRSLALPQLIGVRGPGYLALPGQVSSQGQGCSLAWMALSSGWRRGFASGMRLGWLRISLITSASQHFPFTTRKKFNHYKVQRKLWKLPCYS